jgi:hypothetical protein
MSEPENQQQTPQQPVKQQPPENGWTEADEELLKKKLEELRKRDPFIYR